MNRFRGRMEDNRPICKWNGHGGVYEACAKHKQFIVEVRKYSKAAEISLQQMTYVHTVPIKHYSEHTGNSKWYSEILLKRECGSAWFMCELAEEDHRAGRTMFQCLSPDCRQIMLSPSQMDGRCICRYCRSEHIRPFFMLSKTEMKVDQFSDFLENVWDYMESIHCPCERPDPEWRLKKKKE